MWDEYFHHSLDRKNAGRSQAGRRVAFSIIRNFCSVEGQSRKFIWHISSNSYFCLEKLLFLVNKHDVQTDISSFFLNRKKMNSIWDEIICWVSLPFWPIGNTARNKLRAFARVTILRLKEKNVWYCHFYIWFQKKSPDFSPVFGQKNPDFWNLGLVILITYHRHHIHQNARCTV
jgi:hypothetical protein